MPDSRTSGEIRIGGHNIRDYALDDLRSMVGVVAQDTHIFADTLRHNLLLARPDPCRHPPAVAAQTFRRSAALGRTAVVVCSAGFVADHLEILYDLDIEARQIANEAGVPFVRTRMPNAVP